MLNDATCKHLLFCLYTPNADYLDHWHRWYLWHPMTGVHIEHQLIPDLELPASDPFRHRQVLSLNVSSLPLKWVWQFTSLKTSHTNMSIDSIVHFIFNASLQRKEWIILLWEMKSWAKKEKRKTGHASQGLLCETRQVKKTLRGLRLSSGNFYYLERTYIVKRKSSKRKNSSAWSHNRLSKHQGIKLEATQTFPSFRSLCSLLLHWTSLPVRKPPWHTHQPPWPSSPSAQHTLLAAPRWLHSCQRWGAWRIKYQLVLVCFLDISQESRISKNKQRDVILWTAARWRDGEPRGTAVKGRWSRT